MSTNSPSDPSPHSPLEEDDFVEVARFPSRMEAETVGHALDDHDIPFLVQSSDVGIFGPGMSGFTPEGAQLLVPQSLRGRVQELLTCVVKPMDEEELAKIAAAAGAAAGAGESGTGDS
ncbi:MAG: hypothetical protein AAGD01_04275 [Acidobacteriota bacterium]